MLVGANWDNGVFAGPRAVNVNNWPWNVSTNIGVRLACENQHDSTIRRHGADRSDRWIVRSRSLPIQSKGLEGKTMLAPYLRVGRIFIG